MSGISVLAFAACYATALALEVLRSRFRVAVRAAFVFGTAGAGFALHAGFLVQRAIAFYQAGESHGSPLSSKQDWYYLAAWVLVVVYFYLAHFHPKIVFGPFVLPLVLGLTAVAAWAADPQPFPREPASKVWGIIHGLSILLATVSVLMGVLAGAMYLYQAKRMKDKRPLPDRLRLPSLEWLRQANSRAIVIALFMLGIGVLSGVVLNMIRRSAGEGLLAWTDPVVLSTGLMFGWLLISCLLTVVYRPAREGRKVAYLTFVSLVFLLVVLAFVLFNGTRHGGVRRGGPGESRPPAASVLTTPGAQR